MFWNCLLYIRILANATVRGWSYENIIFNFVTDRWNTSMWEKQNKTKQNILENGIT